MVSLQLCKEPRPRWHEWTGCFRNAISAYRALKISSRILWNRFRRETKRRKPKNINFHAFFFVRTKEKDLRCDDPQSLVKSFTDNIVEHFLDPKKTFSRNLWNVKESSNRVSHPKLIPTIYFTCDDSRCNQLTARNWAWQLPNSVPQICSSYDFIKFDLFLFLPFDARWVSWGLEWTYI